MATSKATAIRVSMVFEYESGPLSDGRRCLDRGRLRKAQAVVFGARLRGSTQGRRGNERASRLGLSAKDAAHIVTTSMSIKEERL